MVGALPLLGSWSWATLCQFFPNLATVIFRGIDIHLKRQASQTTDDFDALDQVVTIDMNATSTPEQIHELSSGTATIIRSIQACGLQPITEGEDEKLLVPVMFLLPLNQLCNFHGTDEWCAILHYRQMAGVPIRHVIWDFGNQYEQIHHFTSISVPGMQTFEAEVWSTAPLSQTLNNFTILIDNRQFPDLRRWRIKVLFDADVGTDELLKDKPQRFPPAFNELPKDLEVEVSLCIVIEQNDPPYHAERLLNALPLMWIDRVKQKLGGSGRVAVDTSCETHGLPMPIPFRPKPVVDCLRRALGFDDGANGNISSTPKAKSAFPTLEQELNDHITNLHL